MPSFLCYAREEGSDEEAHILLLSVRKRLGRRGGGWNSILIHICQSEEECFENKIASVEKEDEEVEEEEEDRVEGAAKHELLRRQDISVWGEMKFSLFRLYILSV